MEAHPEMVRVPARGRDTQRASVIWRRDGKVRVELWTSPGWNRHSAPSGRCVTLPESKVTPAPGDRPSIFGDITVTAEELALDFSVETMGYCHGVNLRPMFSRVWP